MSKKQRSLSRVLNTGLLLMAVPILFISLGTLFIHSRYMIHREAVGGSNSLLNTTLHRVRNYMSVIEYTYSYFPNAYIHFETELDDALCILTNHLYLVRTLRELLYNAAKYTDGMHINLMVSQTDTTVRFTVQDVGPGLPAGSLTQIFKLFSKTGDLSEGLGLGLPLAKRHALSLGGDLIYDARYHKGCRLVLELPK